MPGWVFNFRAPLVCYLAELLVRNVASFDPCNQTVWPEAVGKTIPGRQFTRLHCARAWQLYDKSVGSQLPFLEHLTCTMTSPEVQAL